MSKAVTIHEVGGPEVLRFETVDVGDPGPGEVLLKQSAAGLNFIDTYQRTGLYPLPSFPAVLGMEGAGVVEAVGVGVTEVDIGDRVAYSMAPGAYAERRLVPAAVLVRLPDGISDDQGAAMMLKGCTAQYLIRRTYRIEAGDTILIHAAAGGVGLIVCQWAKHLGATVIGTAGGPDKVALAEAHGCDHAIDYTAEDFVERVGEITNGAGVPVVYDSVGRDTFLTSMDCLQPRGLLVSFGQSSGAIPPFDPGILAQKGSLFLTRPTLGTYIATREELEATARELFDLVVSGAVKIEVNQTYPLEDAATAHRDLEARRTTGSTVLRIAE